MDNENKNIITFFPLENLTVLNKIELKKLPNIKNKILL